MTPLKSPVTKPTLVGFDVIEVTENYRGRYINTTVEEVYSDDSKRERSFTLWMDKPEQAHTDETGAKVVDVPAETAYTEFGAKWTDSDVKNRVDEVLSAPAN